MSATTDPPTSTTTAPAPTPGASAAPEPPTAPGEWPTLAADHALSKLHSKLGSIITEASHDEIFGITLKAKTDSGKPDFHSLLILQKFLRANAGDGEKAEAQLVKALKWRKEFDPVGAMEEIHNADKYKGLGYVTKFNTTKGGKEVVTWNIYGAVKDYELTFLPIEEFLRWRIALMELSVQSLELSKATIPIPDYGEGPDPYQGIQVHDYLNVSFLRMDPRAKAASKAAISILSENYPETLRRKFFVNVPLLMQWMFAAMKLFVSVETVKKFSVLSYGSDVFAELKVDDIIQADVPKAFGGNGAELKDQGKELKLGAKPSSVAPPKESET